MGCVMAKWDLGSIIGDSIGEDGPVAKNGYTGPFTHGIPDTPAAKIVETYKSGRYTLADVIFDDEPDGDTDDDSHSDTIYTYIIEED